eukprot:Selendium_serpulae@DN6461_c0_g1_i3.p1
MSVDDLTKDSPPLCDPNGATAVLPVRPRENWPRRTFRPLTEGGIRTSTLTLTSTALGAGVLATPFATKELGLVVGLIVLLVNGLVATLSSYILLTSTVYFNVHSYPVLFKRITGVGWVVDLLIALNGIGTCTSYFVFVGDFLPKTFQQFASSLERRTVFAAVLKSRAFFLTVALLCVWPLSIQGKLSALRHVSGVPVVSLLFTTAVTVMRAPQLHEAAINRPGHKIVWFNLSWSCAKAFSIFSYTFFQHMNCSTVASEMENPTPTRARKVATRSLFLSLGICLPFALCGYFSWLGDVQQNVINNYPHDDPVITLCRILLSCSMCITIPINMIATGRSAKALWEASIGRRSHYPDVILETGAAESLTCENNLPHQREVPSDRLGAHLSCPSPLEPTESLSEEEPQMEHHSHVEQGYTREACVEESPALRVIMVTFCLFVCYFLALATDQVGDVIGLVGGIFCTSLMGLCPALIYQKGLSEMHSRCTRNITLGILYSFCFAGSVSTAVMVAEKMLL